jgi:hypothetical protein
MQRAVARAAGRFGGLDVVVASAGIASRVATFRAISSESFDRVLYVKPPAAGLGILCFPAWRRGQTVIPKTNTALPMAFGDVFFCPTRTALVARPASAFPGAVIARAVLLNPAARSWPMPVTGMLIVVGWAIAATAVIAVAFRWEPGPAQRGGG